MMKKLTYEKCAKAQKMLGSGTLKHLQNKSYNGSVEKFILQW